jgi:eukaryotic-like serine/threonine-protein kinase
VLGSGGMGVVFEATHLRLRQRVAVKMLRPELAMLGETVARFEREARAAVKLRSRHVARVIDVDALEDGTPYMVMEFLEGRDLSAEIAARGPLPVGEAVDYLLQACDAMAEAHQQGTVHRDLKPSNLFLAAEQRGCVVKVLDFGISKVAEEGAAASVTSTFSVMGTALYMSPEQVRSAKHVDARSDVWALAVILYEMLTGRSPFVGETATAIAAAIVADAPTPLRAYRQGVPPLLDAAIMRGLEKDRDRRFPDAAAFAAAIASFASRDDARHPSPPDEGRFERPSPPPGPAPAMLAAGATATAAGWSRGGARAARARRSVVTAGVAIVAGAIVAAVFAFRPRASHSVEPASIASAQGDLSVPTLAVTPRIEVAREEQRTPVPASSIEPASSTGPASSIEPTPHEPPGGTRSAPIAAPSARPPTLPTSAPAATARPPKAAAKSPLPPAKKAKIDLPADPG